MTKRAAQWKAIPHTSDLYFVSTDGRVIRESYSKRGKDGRRLHFPAKEITQTKDKKGYLSVSIMTESGKRKTLKVHRLVLSAFSVNKHNKPQVNHIDSDKTNNRLENLEWATQEENMEHSVISGTKWTKPVRCLTDGNVFKSMRSAARYYGIGHKEISQCCYGKIQSTQGLEFEFTTKEEAKNGIYRNTGTTSPIRMGGIRKAKAPRAIPAVSHRERKKVQPPARQAT